MGALAGLAVISSVRAEEDITAKIKVACQKSDKTYWVESTGACIPKNPCTADAKYSGYCDSRYENFVLSTNEMAFIIELHNRFFGIECSIQSVIDERYVPCGDRVYKFGNVNDAIDASPDLLQVIAKEMAPASHTKQIEIGMYKTDMLNGDECEILKELAAKYGLPVNTNTTSGSDGSKNMGCIYGY